MYDKCTALPEDEGNWRIEEYCAAIGDDYLTCNFDNGDYCQQRCGAGHEQIKLVLPKSAQETGLQKAMKFGQGTQIINLGKVFNGIADITPKGTECGIGSFKIYTGTSAAGNRRLLQANNWSINQRTQEMKIDTEIAGDISGMVAVASLGNVESNLVPFAISICKSPLLLVKTTAISNLVKPVYELNEEGGSVVIPKRVWGSFVEANACTVCKPNVNIVAAGSAAFTAEAEGLNFDEDENLVVDTSVGRDFSGAIVVSYDGDCADLQEQIRIPIDFTVCGGETVDTKDKRSTDFKFEVGKDQSNIKIDKSQLISFFSNSNPNCALKAFKLTSDEDGTPISPTVAKSIVFDEATGELQILNNNNKAKNFKFYVQAEGAGGSFAYKPFVLEVTDNHAPYFMGFKKTLTLPTVTIKVDPTEKQDTKQVVRLPRAVDREDDKIEYTFTNAKHKWIKKVSF